MGPQIGQTQGINHSPHLPSEGPGMEVTVARRHCGGGALPRCARRRRIFAKLCARLFKSSGKVQRGAGRNVRTRVGGGSFIAGGTMSVLEFGVVLLALWAYRKNNEMAALERESRYAPVPGN